MVRTVIIFVNSALIYVFHSRFVDAHRLVDVNGGLLDALELLVDGLVESLTLLNSLSLVAESPKDVILLLLGRCVLEHEFDNVTDVLVGKDSLVESLPELHE